MDSKNESRPDVSLGLESPCVETLVRRPGTRKIVATVSMWDMWTLSRVGLTLDDAIAEELADYHRGREVAAAGGIGSDDYAANQRDVSLWEGDRCLAVIQPRPGGEPRVTRLV